jgi:hypothetical protein
MVRVYWEPGGDNLADRFTKHHSYADHTSKNAKEPTGDDGNRKYRGRL